MLNPEFAGAVLRAAEELDDRQESLEKKRLRDAHNPYEFLSDERFKKKFRLPKECVQDLCDTLRPRLQRERRHGLSVESQVFAALRFFSRGSYQASVGDNFLISMSQPAVSRAVNHVAQGIYDLLLHQWVKFPDTDEKRNFIMRRFEEERQFKGVLGCLDCTHIKIVRPTRDQHEEAYVNHKGFHSLNVQVVGSHDLEILAINARYPGSVHDSFIWKYSRIRDIVKAHWENGNKNNWLLGDSGYPLEPWLMTPIHHAVEGTPEHEYTRAHCKTRNAVERLFGTWKNTFRCILEDRVLHYEPVVAAKIVLALAVLHNMRRHYNTLNEDDDSESSDSEDEGPRQQQPQRPRQQERRVMLEHDEDEGRVGGELLQEATRVRNRIIRENYTNVEE